MSQEELNRWIKSTKPFTPLRLHLSNGTSFDINHPDVILVGRNTSAILVGDVIHPIANVHINHLEPIAATAN